MTLGLLGHKIGITQIFNNKGIKIPVTIIKCGPCYVTKLKSEMDSTKKIIQIGYLNLSSNKSFLTKSKKNFFTNLNLPPFRYLKEYKVNATALYHVGYKLSIELLNINQCINITGLTVGKGMTSNIKKNHFKCGPMTHGSKHHRLQGSLGAGTSPGRVFPGKKMAGRLGCTLCTIKHLNILDIDLESNLLVIKGSIPGKPGNLISIHSNN